MENPPSNGCSNPAARTGSEVGVAAIETPARVSAKGIWNRSANLLLSG